MKPKMRILNPTLAKLVAELRHGEMLYISDAGGAISSKAIYPLAQDVEYLDLSVATDVPRVMEVVEAITQAGNIEGAILPYGIEQENEEFYISVAKAVGGREHIQECNYAPDFFFLRDRCKAVIQTGDHGWSCNVILCGGFSPTATWDIDVLSGKKKYVITATEAYDLSIDEFNEKYGKK